MRRVVPLLALAALTAGCMWMADEQAPAPTPPSVWHMSSEVVASPGFCGDCHYGLDEFWLTDWALQDGNWSLTVRPRYVEAPLYAVQVGDEPVAAESGWERHESGPGQGMLVEWSVGDADHVLFKAYGSGPDSVALDATANRQDVVVTHAVLVAPDGTRFEAAGPEQDLRIVTAPGQPGVWRAELAFLDGPPDGFLYTYHEELFGELVPHVDGRGATTFVFPANETGAPPATTLRLQPHHDHALFQNTDWDSMDSTPFTIHFTPIPGPAPAPKVWNQTEIDALWDGDEYLMHSMAGSMRALYVDQPGHNDLGFGGGYPGFDAPDGNPVLPGTRTLRLELTWEPATDEPAFSVKFSPANWPYFLYPDADIREPGRAVFEVAITPMWWERPDQTLEWYEPGVVRSYYDIAPYIVEDGELHAAAFDYQLRAYAVR